MVFYSLSSILSLVVAVGGIGISFLSLGVLGLWVGMEINFLGAICYMSGTSVEEGESVMKYFVIQVMGSCFLILGLLMMINFCLMDLVFSLLLLGICLKLGVFPFHFWVVPVMSGLSWPGCFLVSTLQKLVPLWFLSNLLLIGKELSTLEMLGSLTSVVGCLGGLGVLSYRALLGYSSLVNLGVLVILCCAGLKIFWFYMSFYTLLNLCLMGSLSKLGIFSLVDLTKEKSFSHFDQIWWVSLYFLSLAGLPPFSGSVLKVYFLTHCWNFFPVGCLVCVVSSVVSLYFYMSVVLNFSICWGKELNTFMKNSDWDVLLIMNLSVLVNVILGYTLFLLQGV